MVDTKLDSPLISFILSRAIFQGALEVLGVVELKGLLKKGGDLGFENLDQGCLSLSSMECQDLIDSLLSQYGLITAQGLCLRIGQVVFQYLRRNYQEDILGNLTEKRMWPLEKQISDELINLTQWLQNNLACQMEVSRQKEYWLITIKLSKRCHPEIKMISFYFFNGILRECLEWMDSRHRYKIFVSPDSIDLLTSYTMVISYLPIE